MKYKEKQDLSLRRQWFQLWQTMKESSTMIYVILSIKKQIHMEVEKSNLWKRNFQD